MNIPTDYLALINGEYKILYLLKSGGNSAKTGTYLVMYVMINIEVIIDTQIVMIFDEELGITPKDDSHTQLITEENKNLL